MEILNQPIRQSSNLILFRHDGKTYEKFKILGQGSFGHVFLCRKHCENECQYVALKILDVDQFEAKQIDSTINEIRILSILNHKNIIKYYGSFVWRDKFYIEMEYADAGTLNSFLNSLNCSLREFEILALFLQIVTAVQYLHHNNVIHRDIKTKNIFLNKQGFIKLGDFGISKILDKNKDARSFVGTPLYLCPEIRSGKAYNKPADIWSLGCVLFEMTFTSVNNRIPFDDDDDDNNDDGVIARLMSKIIKGQQHHLSLNGQYSKTLEKFINNLLEHNPRKRPTAEYLVQKVTLMMNEMSAKNLNNLSCYSMPNIRMDQQSNLSTYLHQNNRNSFRQNFINYCSYVCRLDLSQLDLNVELMKITCSHCSSIRQLVKSDNHFLALSNDNKVYSWGDGQNGELGQGHDIISLKNAKQIKLLNSYSIQKIGCGQGFSVFVDRNGLVLTCGNYRSQCLGSDDQTNRFRPTIVNELLQINIVDVDCSDDHVVVVSTDGHVYGWGSNQNGKLGINSEKQTVIFPTCIRLDCRVKTVVCGKNATAFIDQYGSIWLCGDNQFNQLALNDLDFGHCFRKKPIKMATKPIRCQAIKGRIKDVCLGEKHSFFILHDDTIIAAGDNSDGQLGLHHRNRIIKPIRVSPLKPKQQFKSIKVGSCFTAILTDDSLYFIGARTILQSSSSSSSSPELQSTILNLSENNNNNFIIANSNQSVMDVLKIYGPDYSIIKISKPKIIVRTINDLLRIDCNHHIVLFAQSILNVYQTKTLPEHSIRLNDIYCHNDVLYVLIDSIQTQDTPPMVSDELFIQQQQQQQSSCLQPSQLSNYFLFMKNDYESELDYAWLDDLGK
uniref:non-specific serine/threonine protein kinase n=1 Tax=Dermatophagoides pteronyssinus TaxID=6956 RepID=A0A6P6YM01_DERPT|nr:serine/threonine-protein kinase Nek8-like [Dermatophagoides pteronyssinus]